MAKNNYWVLEIVWKMAALRDLFYFAQNKKRPAFVSMSDLQTFNLPLLRWHAMYLGTRCCLPSPTNWGLCDRHKKGIYKVEPRMWQRCDRAGDGLTHEFVLNEGKVYTFPDTHEGMRRLEGASERFLSCWEKHVCMWHAQTGKPWIFVTLAVTSY